MTGSRRARDLNEHFDVFFLFSIHFRYLLRFVSFSALCKTERVILKPDSTDLKFERADWRSERADLRPGRSASKPEGLWEV